MNRSHRARRREESGRGIVKLGSKCEMNAGIVPPCNQDSAIWEQRGRVKYPALRHVASSGECARGRIVKLRAAGWHERSSTSVKAFEDITSGNEDSTVQ